MPITLSRINEHEKMSLLLAMPHKRDNFSNRSKNLPDGIDDA